MTDTSIEWTRVPGLDGNPKRGKSWNPVTGCSHASEGCDHCYAETHDRRFSEQRNGRPFLPWTEENAKANVRLHENRLPLPLTWRQPCGVFVNSMSDLFHHEVPFEFIDRVMRIIVATPHHTYLVLTKRPAIMLRYFRERYTEPKTGPAEKLPPNLWLGTSVETQQWAEARIPPLLAIPANVRFLSCEPLLGRLILNGEAGGCLSPKEGRWGRGVDWVIVGAESGHAARPMDINWVREIQADCTEHQVPFFLKQFATDAGHKIPTPELDGQRWTQFPQVNP